MATVKSILSGVKGWASDIVELLLALALIFLVIDILFGPTLNIVDNLVAVINSFVSQGVIGLIALLIFLAIYNK
ncbi:MAG: hypothetical protein JRJ27_02975 [Deltaproteobacteria bacterium]|nr:hypothetical protein [Deltaproteobacteria bacterium]